MAEQRRSQPVDVQGDGQRQPVQPVPVAPPDQGRARDGVGGVRPGDLAVVEGGEHLPLAVAVHPHRAVTERGQPVQRPPRHRPERDVAQQDHRVRAGHVGLGEHGLQGRQVAVDVGQYGHSHHAIIPREGHGRAEVLT